MDTDTILTFHAPSREPARVSSFASPVTELAYAIHYLLVRFDDTSAREHDVGWIGPLLDERPDLLHALREFATRHGQGDLSPMLLVLAARYGYDRDSGPERYLHDLESLPRRFVSDGLESGTGGSGSDDRAAREAAFRANVARLADATVAAELRALVTRLWEVLAPAWQREGRAAVVHAAAEFHESFERTGSVLASLPPHHFTRFEHSAQSIREGEQRGRVIVIPLFFASTGGFNFRIDDTHYVGFGLLSETVFERTAQQVASLAQRAKAFGDPTRLMALALVGRFSALRLTVGDLAEHIGVSQPTLSGHLKLLREAGLVDAERIGNKSYYRIDRDGVRGLLEELGESLLD